MRLINYFSNTLSFTTDTYLETLSAEDIESFRYLHFNTKNSIETKIVYTDVSTYRRLTIEQKTFAVLIKKDEKRIRMSPVNTSRFIISGLTTERSKTNMLSKLKFVRKVQSNTVTGKERFSLKYLYEHELKHFTITLTKDDFIMPKFKIDDSSVPKKIKEVVKPGRDELTIHEKEIDYQKKSATLF